MRPLQSSHNLIQEPQPRLPFELLDLIVKFAPAEAYASLVLCNKWLYKTCNPLRYRDLYLYTPAQIIKLYESEKARSMLSITESLFIDEMVFFNEPWESIHTDVEPVEYLLRILQTTVSLRQLRVLRSRATDFEWKSYGLEFCTRFHTQFHHRFTETTTFLPKLDRVSLTESVERLISNYVPSLAPPFPFYSLSKGTTLSVSIANIVCAATDHIHSSAPIKARPRAQCRPTRDLSARDVGLFIREDASEGVSSRPAIKALILAAQFMYDPVNNMPPSIDDAFPWIRQALLATGCLHIELLLTVLVSPVLEPSISAQYSALEELQKNMPALTTVMFPSWSMEWRRQIPSGDASPAYPTLPEWTPRPSSRRGSRPQVLAWWVDALNLQVPKTQDRETLKVTAGKLREAMLTRWSDEDFLRDEEWVYRQLLAHT